MRSKIIGFTLYVLAVITHGLTADDFPMNQLKQVADGLNIEGGTIDHKYLRQDQIWSNLCIVLDRPFEDGVEWQEITSSNTFPLKEAAILDYNEAQVNFTYATVMHYYITHAHQIARKPLNQTANILIQVHRNSSGPRHLELLEQLLIQCYPELKGIKQSGTASLKYELFSYAYPEINVQVNFCYGTVPEELGELGKYGEADIVLSFSLVAGLHSEWKSGSVLVPNQFIPFSLKTVVLALEEQYSVRNHLQQVVLDIINDQEEGVLKTINEHFCSFNPQKNRLKARNLTAEDFKHAILLQVDGLFNPSQLPVLFTLTGKN